ncbi:MAG: UDP-glucose 4-epimerase GalE [Deltaproteobacteria bacterium]
MSILVTGGSGYIGSQVVLDLLKSGRSVVVLDNLSTGHAQALQSIKKLVSSRENEPGFRFYYGDTRNGKLVTSIMVKERVSAVVHLAAYSQVGESMQNPGKYFDNNLSGTVSVLDCMVRAEVKHIVFSSTAAVYGEPEHTPIGEDHPTRPTNVYGASKLMVEEILSWYDQVYGLKHIALRYFNAAGADASGTIGEHHQPETHLIPLVLGAATGIHDRLTIYGDDYLTPDGTCVRDYIHVSDLAAAHMAALNGLEQGRPSGSFNLGNGSGYSVKDVIKAATRVTGLEVPFSFGRRRAGDPAVLVADANKVKNELGWSVKDQDLESIIASAWAWHKSHPHGYIK